MALTIATPKLIRASTALSVLSLSIIAGGCAQMGTPSLASLTSDSSANASQATPAADPQNSLAAATAYWGKEFAKKPTELEPAMAYAKNLKAMGRKKQALAVLQQAAVYHGDKPELAGEYGRLALGLGQVKIAEKVLAQADNPAKPDWRVISARGTVMAKQGRYKDAIPFYQRALAHAPEHPSILNNLAMAHAMGGDPATAEGMLRQAVANGGDSKRVRQNLALVLGLQGRYDESAKVGSKDMSLQSAASDTAQLRKLVKLDPVRAPVNAGATQLAAVPGLKGTNADTSSAGGWGTKVAAARK
ncbi:MAG: tetratricopeptide repeat protein [Alphaproteobacteria bacterium]|nr:tetratricopeptide repeat protein [Alphaproteobacteria bacterium]